MNVRNQQPVLFAAAPWLPSAAWQCLVLTCLQLCRPELIRCCHAGKHVSGKREADDSSAYKGRALRTLVLLSVQYSVYEQQQ